MAAQDEQLFAKQLGRALAAARLSVNLTQEQVADHLGVFVETISRFERGANWPTLPRLIALANLYQVPLTTLLLGSSNRALDIAADLSEQLRRLTEEDRAWVSSVIRELCHRLPHEGKSRHRAQRLS